MKRINSILEILEDKQAVLIYTPVSRLYLSGFQSSLGYLFISQKESVLFVDGRYIEAAEKSVKKEIRVELLSDLKNQAKELLKSWEVSELLCETSNTVADVSLFQRIFGVKVTASETLENKLLELRLIKDETEIENITIAQRMAEKAFEQLLNFIKPGVSEIQIAARLEYQLKLAGSIEPSFSTIAISGEKTSMPHGVPGDRIIKDGDFITMDFGALYKGYHSDITRTVAVGYVTDEMQTVYDTVLAANLKALEKVKEGVTAKEVDLAAREVITGAGYGKAFTHSTGHGVGLDVHEAPNVSFKNEQKLVSGQIITIEPGIYLPDKFGGRIEDMVVVTKNGCNNLTKTSKTLIII